MRLHGVLISKYIALLLFSIVWNHWGDLRSHGVLHIWDDSLFCIFSFSSCACNGRRSWGDFSWQLGGVVPWRMTVDCNVGLRWRWEFHMDLIHWLPISSYVFFCFNGCHAQRPVTCQSLGQLGPSEIRRAQAYWHRGFGSLHRDREEGKNRKDCWDIGNEHWRYMNIRTYYVHESWIWNDLKNPEDIWEVSVWCCLPVFIFCITWQGGWLLDSHLMCDMGLMASRWAELSHAESSKRSGVANGTWTYYMWSLILLFTHIYSHIIIIMIITFSVVATIISTYM